MLKVRLELFMEQGSEGAHWCVYDETKKGYDGLISLNNRDRLIIPSVNFNEIIDKDYESYRQWYRWCQPYLEKDNYRGMLESRGWVTKEMSNLDCKTECLSNYKQQVVNGYCCHWVQKNADPKLWGEWFEKELPAFFIDKDVIK